MRRSDIAAALAVPLAIGLVLAATGGTTEPDPSEAVRTVPVEQTTLACPPLQAGPTEPDDVSGAVVSPRLDIAADLPRSPVQISAGGQRLARLSSRGSSWSRSAPAIADGLEVEVEGALAAGLTAAVGAVFDDNARGLVTQPCDRPASHWWFVGAASTFDRTARLNLANPTPGVAVVDLAFYGPDGPVEAVDAQGIAIPPGGSRSVPLADLVPGVDSVTVEVTSRQGEVAASLTEVERDALDPAGVEAIPAAAEPRRTSVLTGIPAGRGQHTLSVVNAGDSEAVVELEVLGPRGSFTPSDLESVRVPAHSVVEERLTGDVLDGDVAGIRLSADQPVSAAVRTTTGSPLRDQSYAAAAQPLDTGAVTPALPGLNGELVLSAVGRDTVTVDVETTSVEGETLGTRTVELGGGQTRSVQVPERGRPAYLRVRSPGAGELVGAVLWSEPDSEGLLSSGFPLSPLRLTVQRPPVQYRVVAP